MGFGINNALDVAKKAIYASQLALSTTSQNIANVNTPGYTKQKLILSTEEPLNLAKGDVGRGVRVENVARVYNRYLEESLFDTVRSYGRWKTEGEKFKRIEDIFDEVSENGFSKTINQFWESWQKVSDDPTDESAREVLVKNAIFVSQELRRIKSDLKVISRDIDEEIKGVVDDVNSIVKEIASLNVKIVDHESIGANANDYRDRRDELIKELSEKIGIQVVKTGDDKQVTVLLKDTGEPLVDAGFFWQLSTDQDASGNLRVFWKDPSGYLKDIGEGGGGILKGLFEVRDDRIGSYIQKLDNFANTLIKEINKIHTQGVGLSLYDEILGDYETKDVNKPIGSQDSGLPFYGLVKDGSFSIKVYKKDDKSLVEERVINISKDSTTLSDIKDSIDASGYLSAEIDNGRLKIKAATGYEFSFADDTSYSLSALGINVFFSGKDSDKMAVSSNITSDVSKIAASLTPYAESDNRNALNIVNLREKKVADGGKLTMDESYRSLVSRIGVDAREAHRNLEHEETIKKGIEERIQEVSGVSLDEEMINLIKFQHAFSAAAKLIEVADRLLEDIIKMV